MRVVCISDTHGLHRAVRVPDGDILVHAGDLSRRGELETLADFDDWLSGLPHAHKLIIAGNHDFCFENHRREQAIGVLQHACYLQDSSCCVEGLTIWGTPWQPWFHDWAFNVRSEEARAEIWARIPEQTDILIVHGPPQGCGDRTQSGHQVGCQALHARIAQIAPKLVVTGHIHEAYGSYSIGLTRVVNASICTLRYQPTNPPIVIDL